jgi:hypothetical protein
MNLVTADISNHKYFIKCSLRITIFAPSRRERGFDFPRVAKLWAFSDLGLKLHRLLGCHCLYNAHVGVPRVAAGDEAPAGSFEK